MTETVLLVVVVVQLGMIMHLWFSRRAWRDAATETARHFNGMHESFESMRRTNAGNVATIARLMKSLDDCIDRRESK